MGRKRWASQLSKHFPSPVLRDDDEQGMVWVTGSCHAFDCRLVAYLISLHPSPSLRASAGTTSASATALLASPGLFVRDHQTIRAQSANASKYIPIDEET